MSALFTGNKIKRARPRGDGTATSATQTQSSGCDGRISIVHFQKLCLNPPGPPYFHLPNPISITPTLKRGDVYLYIRWLFFPKRAVATPIPNDATVSGNAVGGGNRVLWGGVVGRAGGQLKKKARMIQSLRMPYFRCKMDIRVET